MKYDEHGNVRHVPDFTRPSYYYISLLIKAGDEKIGSWGEWQSGHIQLLAKMYSSRGIGRGIYHLITNF